MRTKTLPKNCQGKFVIQRIEPIEYHAFNSVDDFIEYYSRVNDDKKMYNEVIFNTNQKMRIDIDAPYDQLSDDEWNEVIKVCHHVFKSLLSNANIAVYEMSDNYKRSCHMVCTTLYFENAETCKYLGNLIVGAVRQYGKYVDLSVYNKTQHFRIEYSIKPRTERRKILSYNGNEYYDFKYGLITYIENCKKGEVKIKPTKSYNTKFTKCSYKIHLDWCVPTSQSSDGRLIILKRIKPSFCEICCRIHQSENPYIVITDDGSALLNCRRSDSQQYTILTIDGNNIL